MRLSALYEAALGRRPSRDSIELALQQGFYADNGTGHHRRSGTTNGDVRGVLSAAITHHRKNFGGERWPQLEDAFMKRSNTYFGNSGDYVRPRLMLINYLNNLNEPWEVGQMMIDQMLRSITSGKLRLRSVGGLLSSNSAFEYIEKNYGEDMLKAVFYRLHGAFGVPLSDKWSEFFFDKDLGRSLNDYGEKAESLPDSVKQLKPRSSDEYYAEILKHSNVKAKEVDWRPTETTPEDFYAM